MEEISKRMVSRENGSIYQETTFKVRHIKELPDNVYFEILEIIGDRIEKHEKSKD